jgi:hypothetical protein
MTDTWFVALLAGGALVAILLLFQRRFIYFPLRYSTTELQGAKSIGTQEIRFRTSQGNQTAFFWQTEDSAAAPKNLWLVFGGNGDLALAWLNLVRAFPSPYTAFLLVDYPGYGICQGKPNPRTILENAEGALQTLLKWKGWIAEVDALCVLGHSLGGAVALQFAAGHSVRKIVVGFYIHLHGRNGSKTDWHNFGTASPAPVRQPDFPCNDSFTGSGTGDCNSSRPIRRDSPA